MDGLLVRPEQQFVTATVFALVLFVILEMKIVFSQAEEHIEQFVFVGVHG